MKPLDPPERRWTDLELYVLHEHIEDFEDGLITRRELIRRVTFFTGSVALTVTVLASLGCNVDAPRTAASPAAAPTPAVPSPTAAATAAATAYAIPPAAPSVDGVTVRPDDPRITAAPADVKGPDGASLMGYLARPKADGRYPGVLVIHENRGQTPHIQDVIRRTATAGFVALGIDLLARQGGAARIEGGAYSSQLSARSPDDMLADHLAALDLLRAQSFVKGDALGVTGFCFGGGLTWNVVAANVPNVKAAAPYYGPAPRNASALATTKIAVFAVYAEQDAGITGSAAALDAELKRSGTPYRMTIYPGVGHGFHNDTGARYNADQAQKAWIGTIEWFKKYLV